MQLKKPSNTSIYDKLLFNPQTICRCQEAHTAHSLRERNPFVSLSPSCFKLLNSNNPTFVLWNFLIHAVRAQILAWIGTMPVPLQNKVTWMDWNLHDTAVKLTYTNLKYQNIHMDPSLTVLLSRESMTRQHVKMNTWSGSSSDPSGMIQCSLCAAVLTSTRESRSLRGTKLSTVFKY